MISHKDKVSLLKQLQAGQITLEEFKTKLSSSGAVDWVIRMYYPIEGGGYITQTGRTLTEEEYKKECSEEMPPGSYDITLNLNQ